MEVYGNFTAGLRAFYWHFMGIVRGIYGDFTGI